MDPIAEGWLTAGRQSPRCLFCFFGGVSPAGEAPCPGTLPSIGISVTNIFKSNRMGARATNNTIPGQDSSRDGWSGGGGGSSVVLHHQMS